jgi:hypothetical protein
MRQVLIYPGPYQSRKNDLKAFDSGYDGAVNRETLDLSGSC